MTIPWKSVNGRGPALIALTVKAVWRAYLCSLVIFWSAVCAVLLTGPSLFMW
jgi:hypothetical protein